MPMGHIQLLEYMTGQTLEGEVSDWLPPALVPDALADAAASRHAVDAGDLRGPADARQPGAG